MIDRTLTFIMGQQWFKTLGASRTDTMVSANHAIFELFLKEPIEDLDSFLDLLNRNLPADIKALRLEETDKHFNIIKTPKQKEYIYLFAHGQKANPFSSPFMSTFQEDLDLELMQEGARYFEGEHDFRAYTKKPSQEKITIRTVERSEIVANEYLTGSFFPSPSYAYVIQGKGFMRNQIRMMMGQLLRLGRNEINLDYLQESLKTGFPEHLSLVVPASGLILNEVSFS